jgi:nucleoporin POM152
VVPFTFGLLSQTAGSRDTHLLGQHTVRMSPISTAQLNPQAINFCLPTPTSVVHVPILLNNTNLSGLKYSVTPLGYPTDVAHGKVELVEISAKDIKAISQAFRDALQQARPSRLGIPEDRDEYDDDDESHEQTSHSMLQKSQSVVYLRLTRPGTIRLEHVLDVSGVEARLSHSEVVVVPCPEVAFVEDVQSTNDTIRCAGQDSDIKLMIDVRGVPPLSIRWLKTINGVREQFLVEGIETDHRRGSGDSHPDPSKEVSEKRNPSSLALKIPLTVSLDEPGTYVYALEEITDGVGNVVHSGHDLTTANQSISKTKTTRSFVVLKKPAISFDHCSTDAPTPLLIGSEATLSIKAVEADDFDAPWEVYVKYQPLTDPDSVAANKRLKPWKKTLKTEGGRRELNVRASLPGEYTIAGIKGKVCNNFSLSFNYSSLR